MKPLAVSAALLVALVAAVAWWARSSDPEVPTGATREGAKLAVLSESRVAAIFALIPCAGVGVKPSVRKV